MRCITAICPAGPPKLSAAIRAQVRAASRKLGRVTRPWLSGGAGERSRGTRKGVSQWPDPPRQTHEKARFFRHLAATGLSGISPASLAGQVAEWLKAHAWKVCNGESRSRVRIPLCPPPSLAALMPKVEKGVVG